jgi:hypothetical protein
MMIQIVEGMRGEIIDYDMACLKDLATPHLLKSIR